MIRSEEIKAGYHYIQHGVTGILFRAGILGKHTASLDPFPIIRYSSSRHGRRLSFEDLFDSKAVFEIYCDHNTALTKRARVIEVKQLL